MINLKEAFKAVDDEYIALNQITEHKPSARPDLCAFLKLEELVPGTEDIVSAAVHDEIYLGINCDRLAEVATEADILYLVRCGVRYSDYGTLCMFV